MRIRTALIGVISLAMLLAVARLLLVFTGEEVRRELETIENTTDRINDNTVNLVIFGQDFALKANQRASQQWYAVHDDLRKAIGALKGQKVISEADVSRLDRDIAELPNLLANLKEATNATVRPVNLAQVAMLSDQMLAQSRLVGETARDMSAQVEDARRLFESRERWLSVFFPLAFLFLISCAAFIVVRRVVEPSNLVQAAAIALEQGDMGARSNYISKGEMGDLASRFDAMARELQKRTVALVEARNAAEAVSETKSAFLATMSHEIRTPMNGVIGSVDLLQRSELSPYQRDLVDTVGESSQALLTIIDDILDFSKIEAGRLTLHSEPVSLVQLTDSVGKALRATAAACSVALQTDVAPGVPDWVLSDAVRLRQILNNLLGNALKFSANTSRAGRVELRIQVCGPDLPGHLQLSVIDNGIGMSPEKLERIFEPFVQAESNTTRRFGGTGLGLSICKRLTNMMGGWVEVDSVLGRGSTFRVTLPFEQVEAPLQSASYTKLDSQAITPNSGPRFVQAGTPLVLVAEDNEINQKLIGHQLALLGMAVEIAENGQDALDCWRAGQATQRHALLLTDLHMPLIDGYTLAATIRSEEADGTRMPIVALSANALKGEIDRCRNVGMDDYLSKPVKTEQLDEMLRRWLPAQEAHKLDSLEHLDCEDADVHAEPGPCVYDDQALERLVGNDPELLADFRQHFVLSALSAMEDMRRAASQEDLATLAEVAHRLKSSSGSIGAVSLAECCERMERAGHGCSTTEMHRHMAQMEDALAHVMTCLSVNQGLHYPDLTH